MGAFGKTGRVAPPDSLWSSRRHERSETLCSGKIYRMIGNRFVRQIASLLTVAW
jgi:hypothetical protein